MAVLENTQLGLLPISDRMVQFGVYILKKPMALMIIAIILTIPQVMNVDLMLEKEIAITGSIPGLKVGLMMWLP